MLLLSEIFDLLQERFKEPPFDTIVIAVNRALLLEEGKNTTSQNRIAVENLRVLNLANERGLWGGKVRVFEAGMPSLKGTRFEKYPGISGAITDYFLAVQANLFVGSEVSSFSTDVIASRFFRGKRENFFYLPRKVELATHDNSTYPPRFTC